MTVPEKPSWVNWIEDTDEPWKVVGVECRGCHGRYVGLDPKEPDEHAGTWNNIVHTGECSIPKGKR